MLHSGMNIFKVRNTLKGRLEQSDNKNAKKPKKRPKRLENPYEMLKYFISRTSLHGIKYSQDAQLFRIERAIWLMLVIAGFYFAISVILKLYCNFKEKQTNIVIDEINYDIFHVPFPSVTLCPGTRIDWNEVNKLAKLLIPEASEEEKLIFLELLKNASGMRLSRLNKLRLENANTSVLDSLNKKINITDVLIKLLPKCEKIFAKCSWRYTTKNCCEIFELQRTSFGFCYTFNSLVSLEKKFKEPRKTHAYGVRSGIKVVMQKGDIGYPSHFKDNQTAIFMMSHPMVQPSKARYIAFGHRYNIDIKFSSAFASPEVLELETMDNPPCKYDNGSYKFENCLGQCQQKYIEKICGCNPTFFFPDNDSARECNWTDLECITTNAQNISEVHFSLASESHHNIKSLCDCPTECEYYNYDDFVIGLPYYTRDSIFLDIHYQGPTGIRYKREIVVSDLDMLVQLGGIFGLFLGGSLLTIMEFMYCFIVGMLFYIYQSFLHNNRKMRDNRVSKIDNINSYEEKKVYPLLDFPLMVKQNRLRY